LRFGVRGSRFRVQGSGFRVQGSGFRVQGSRFKVQGSRLKVQGSRFKVQGSRFKVQGSRSKVQGLGFRVSGLQAVHQWKRDCGKIPSSGGGDEAPKGSAEGIPLGPSGGWWYFASARAQGLGFEVWVHSNVEPPVLIHGRNGH